MTSHIRVRLLSRWFLGRLVKRRPAGTLVDAEIRRYIHRTRCGE